MQNGPAAVVQASPPNFARPTPFALFEQPVRFHLDPQALESKYYSLSRTLHPDRFASGDTFLRVAALEQMSWVNEAYALLRDPMRVREWILGRFINTAVKAIPVEWAERWFEVQETPDAIPGFAQELDREMQRLDAQCREWERFSDSMGGLPASMSEQEPISIPPEQLQLLAQIAQAESTLSYLRSLKRDIEQ